MHVTHSTVPQPSPHQVLVLSGPVAPADTDHLRGWCYRALTEPSGGDLVVDVRAVTAFDDAAMAALSSGRLRARHLARHLVVVDAVDGALATSLRRTGLAFRFPRYDSPELAAHALAAERTDRASHDLPQEARWRAAATPAATPAAASSGA